MLHSTTTTIFKTMDFNTMWQLLYDHRASAKKEEISFTCVQHDQHGTISRDINNMKAMTKPDLPGYPEVNYHPDDFPIVLLDD